MPKTPPSPGPAPVAPDAAAPLAPPARPEPPPPSSGGSYVIDPETGALRPAAREVQK